MTIDMSTPTIPVLTRRIGDLAREKAELQRQLDEARASIATLRFELAAAMLPYSGHRMELVNGVPTVFQNSGVVYEMVESATYTDQETSFRREWRALAPVPGSPAARVAAAIGDVPEMACLHDMPDDFRLALEAQL